MYGTVFRHVGAHYVMITDVVKELSMEEGFDVGLEMSESAQVFRGMLSNMCRGAKLLLLGIQESNAVIDWNQVIFNDWNQVIFNRLTIL